MACLRLVLAYDGSGFSGFAANPGVRTVEGVLRDALERRLSGQVTGFACAGRTDAGVHASGQVVSFDAPEGFSTDEAELHRMLTSLNRMLGPEIAVLSAEEAPEAFNARFSATSRRYRYLIWNQPAPDPFTWRHTWHVPQPLDVEAMVSAAACLPGEHDFASFCRRSSVEVDGVERVAPTTRRVLRAAWEASSASEMRFEIEANSFCRQMVRSLVGTLVDVGRRRLSVDDFVRILRAADRSATGPVAPPHGLCLHSVGY